VLLLLLAGAIVAIFVGSRDVQVAGWVVAGLLVTFAVADQLTIRSGGFGLMTQGRADTGPISNRGESRSTSARGEPGPEYIPEAVPPPEEVWRREQERYREKRRREEGVSYLEENGREEGPPE
jgi:hypothetical protein